MDPLQDMLQSMWQLSHADLTQEDFRLTTMCSTQSGHTMISYSPNLLLLLLQTLMGAR